MSAVDVLAVMADASGVMGRDGYTSIPNDLIEARAAVAELIEASQYVSDYTLAYSARTYNPAACKEADDRLRAALARIGGRP